MEETTEEKKSFWLLPLTLIYKLGKLVKLIKLVQLLKFTKVFITFFTMALSTLVYSFTFGSFWFAIGFVVMLFIHEMGHIIAMNKKGYQASAPVFIPMLGAAIFAPKFNNYADEAYIGFGGPFVGGLMAFAVFILWAILPQKHESLLLIGYTATSINLFNMLPIRPFDGGRITHLIGGWFKLFGLTGLLLLTFLIKEPSIILIWILILQDIKLQPNFKFITAVMGTVSMTSLMLMGYSDQKCWVDILDIVFASVITSIFYFEMKDVLSQELEEQVNAPISIKIKWLILYLLLLSGLIALTFAQIPYLPHAITK